MGQGDKFLALGTPRSVALQSDPASPQFCELTEAFSFLIFPPHRCELGFYHLQDRALGSVTPLRQVVRTHLTSTSFLQGAWSAAAPERGTPSAQRGEGWQLSSGHRPP